LYTALDGALTLIHPFMPFLTEELWQRIPRRQGDSTPSISLARYPTYDETFNDEAAEADYELILDVCKAIRSLVAAYPMSTGARLYCQFHVDSDLDVAQEHLGSIRSLSGKGIGSIEILSKKQAKPTGCVTYNVSSEAVVFLHVQGRVDLEMEISKATTKLNKATEGRQKCQKLLGDSEFLNKVDEKVANAERAKLADYDAEIHNTTDMISQFQSLKLEGSQG
jgi:valyl-tRNA synthetase